MLKKVVLLKLFVETLILFFWDYLINKSSKKTAFVLQHRLNVTTVIFDQFKLNN